MKRVLAAALPAALLAVLTATSGAVVTSTWTVETYQQFDQGDATSAFITSLGEIRPGWNTKRLGDEQGLEGDGVWSALRLSSGDILLGTDAGGALFKASGDKVTKVATIEGAIAVVALAQGSDGTVYAGTMPGDKVWKVDLKTGKATAYATIKDAETVWSLAVSGGAVYAGTGPDGKLFKVTKGAAKEVFATEDKRITALAATSDGAIWLGTSERALVFRHDPDKSTTRAMADFAGNEISAITPVGGGVIVAANELSDMASFGAKSASAVEDADNPGAPKGVQPKMPDSGSTPGAEGTSSNDLARKGARSGKGALFRVADDGRLTQLHALTSTYFTSIAVDKDGQVYAGAADKGRIYLVADDDSVATAFDVDERAVSHVFWDGKQLAFATDDKAALYRATGKASKAKYVSEVFDARAASKFGKLTWQASGKLTIETRSGNTAKPGPGWSEWEKPGSTGKLGGGTTGGKIASPAGRYLQFRVSFDEGDASLRRVSAFYVPQNEASKVEKVDVETAGKAGTPTLKDSSARARDPVARIRWSIDNPDNDDTTYVVEVRRDGEADWTTLVAAEKQYSSTSYDWNTEAYADGWYRVRVTSSDGIANSPDRTLTSTATSPLFSVDNTRPTIEGLKVTYPKATAKATDAINVITEMSFSIDDGAWQLGTTGDGIFDDLSESLVVEMPKGLAKGTHTLAIRVADASGNVGSTSTTFVVK